MTGPATLALASAYLSRYPAEAARAIDAYSPAEIERYLSLVPPERAVPVMNALTPMTGATVLERLPVELRLAVLQQPERSRAVALLGQMPDDRREQVLGELPDGLATQLRQTLEYPEATAGRLMDTAVFSLPAEETVGRAMALLREPHRGSADVHFIKLLDAENRLAGVVDVRKLAFNSPDTVLSSLARAVPAVVGPMAPREEVVEALEAHSLDELMVVDQEGRILGIVRHGTLLNALKSEASLDIQTMVGVSKDERALSSSWFALRKRMPWLQINLLTAFLAASVVGFFENTIATFTALAVLLPVVAGQSGNAGAQALAVTMRGLALREITIGHWLRVMRKEMNAGFWNGVAIAITCGIGVFLWSGSVGLVLVIALSMVISMVAAGIAGALVPIVLARLGQDPAVASSIILTTVTDVAGFFSFLGIATLLSGMLVAGG
ncbi:magnesium transporter [Oceanibacterium hippocampi]|uniref:Magnesium transporter MgtE n=1 Tax=Oceanibacterium hippocampi TaxID=745714 RepID=A0A1Y5TG12_9PROT|nr:magnesium transporter [Oceanibacterium hippocampi]SLN63235.1 Magnesium transporter MgtE [Oceanibacterium hippocampi]